MRTPLLSTILLAGLTWTLTAAPLPPWAASSGSETGIDEVLSLTGFGISNLEGKSAEAQQSAKDKALKDASGKLKTRVDASSQLTDSESGKANFSFYQADVKTMVTLNIGGVEKYELAFLPDQNRWAALVIINKEQMRRFLASERDDLVARLEADLRMVRDLTNRKALDELKKNLGTFEGHLEELVENVAVARLLRDEGNPQTILQKYYDARSEASSNLLAAKLANEGDIVRSILKFFPWKDLAGKSVVVTSPVYKTSEISSPFFGHLKDSLIDALTFQFPEVTVLPDRQDARPDLALRGSFQEDSQGGFLFQLKLSDLKNGRIAAPVYEVDLDKEFLKANQRLAILPPNFQEALGDDWLQKSRFAQPVKTELQVSSTAGNSGVTLAEGTPFRFMVKVNRPGYITMIYTLANPTHDRTRLINNHKINASQIGEWVLLDPELEVQPPYGTESAHFFFTVDPGKDFQTKMVDIEGYPYEIITGDFIGQVAATRGAGARKKTSDADKLAMDAAFTLTTVPKR